MLPSVVKRAAGASLLLSLSAPALAQSSDNQPLSCVDNHHNGTIYTGGVNEFDIICGIDYAGADIRAAHANSFEHCIQLCEETDGCIVVSYGGGLGGGGCWMKDKLNTANPNGGVWTARSRNLPEPPVSCENNRSNGTTYTAPTGGEFLVLCGVDYGGGDMGVHDIRTFGGCMDKCDSTPGCVDVSYVGTACYLKSQLGPQNHAGHVWTGRRISSSTVTPTNTATTTSTSSSSTSTSATSRPTSTGAPTCEHNASDETSYLAGSGSVWEIACGREYYGGDLRRETHPTFQACIESCDADSQCMDVSYVGQDCWMKKYVTGSLVHAAHAWTAKKVQNAPGSGTSTGATAGPTATSHPSVLTCVNKADDGKTYTTDNRKIYEIRCGADFAGSDLYARTLPSFEDCIHYCDSLDECRGVSYAGDQCYPKSRLNDVTNRDHVWGAMFVGIAPAVGPTGTAADSPPLDTATVVMPEDPEWTATYTWYEQELPTFTSVPVEMPPDPTGTPLCLADPAATPDATFHLIDVDHGFIVNRGDRPGNPENPTSEEEAEALLETLDSWTPAVYTWEHPAGAPEGLYDIVLTDETGKHYLSINSDGEVVFASESSASTTVFSAGCDGRVIIQRGNVQSSWVTNEDGFTTVVPHSAESDRIIVLPPQIRASPAVSEPAKRAIRQSFHRRELANFPRCPARGANIFAVANPFRRGENPNGCGSGPTEKLVPDFNWGHCCNDHDNCFDNCDRSFERCNNEFLDCMTAQCRADLKWWNFWLYPSCVAVAHFYKAVVSSSSGVDAFNQANKERCVCPCNNPSVEVFCRKPNTQHDVECRNVRRSDNENCGGCDWKCPYKTKCARDSCECVDHRCGNTCLNLNNHPNNCGRCGNKCDSGFCWQGACYDPPAEPEFCIPGQAVSGTGEGWSGNNGGGFDGSTATIQIRVGEFDFLTTTGGISTTAKVCPGENYDLTFRIATRATWPGASPNCKVKVWVGNRGYFQGPNVQFPLNTWPLNFYTDAGPYPLGSFAEQDYSVVNNVYLGVSFSIQIECDVYGLNLPFRPYPLITAAIRDISFHPA